MGWQWFVIQNDALFDFAVGRSAGSLSPRVKWEHLKNYEFELPASEEEQRKLADVLWSIEQTRKSYNSLLRATDELVKSQFIELFGDPFANPKKWLTCTLEEACAKIVGGGTPSKSKPEYYLGNIPWVTPKDMKQEFIIDSEDHITEAAIKESTTNLIPKESVLMVIRSGILKHSLPVAINKVVVTINQDMKAFVPSSLVDSTYLLYFFKNIEKDVLQGVRSVTADNIDFKSFVQRLVQVPPISLQKEFSSFVEQLDKSKFTIQNLLRIL